MPEVGLAPEFDEANAQYAYFVDFIQKALIWAAQSPEDSGVAHLYIDHLDVMLEGELVGRIYTGDELRFVPVKNL